MDKTRVLILFVISAVICSCSSTNRRGTYEIKDRTGKVVYSTSFTTDILWDFTPAIKCEYGGTFILEKYPQHYWIIQLNSETKKFEKIGEFDAARCFSEGLALVRNGGKYGFVNRKGAYEIEPKFKDALDFHWDVAAVRTFEGKWGFIHRDGKYAVEPKYYAVLDSMGSTTIVSLEPVVDLVVKLPDIDIGFPLKVYGYMKQGKWVVIDRLGKIINEPGIIYLGNRSSDDPGGSYVMQYFGWPVAAATKEGKWGYIDQTGKFVIKAKFDFAELFYPDAPTTKVVVNGKWKTIDKKGNYISEPK